MVDGHLKVFCYESYNCLEVHHFNFECVGDTLYMAIIVEVDCKEHGNNLTVHFVFPILHGLVKVLNSDHRMGRHCLWLESFE